jgi:Tfp pilus assembly protein PilP
MRLAKSSRTLLPLALSAVLATCALAQDSPNSQINAARDQLMKQAPDKPQPPSAPQAPAPPPAPAKKSAPATATAPAKAPVKAAAKSPEKVPAKVPEKAPEKAPAAVKDSTQAASASPAAPPVEKPVEEKPVVRRDPFDTLLTKARAGNAPPENLPPGKAGLIVETLRIDGIVRSPNGMIAIVSNSQQRVYFLREGDKLYDGSVEKIALDAISFHEIGKDAFGKPLERVVSKRLYPSSGEQQ